MKAEIEICQKEGCAIVITGQEVLNAEYSESTSTNAGEYTYLETLVINALYKVNSSEEETLLNVTICNHALEEIDGHFYQVPDSSSFTLDEDGLYKIVHIIVPTKTWIQNYKELTGNYPDMFESIYVSDGTSMYLFKDGEYTTVGINELINARSEDIAVCNLVYCDQYTFTLCHLDNCLFKICSKLLKEYCPLECTNNIESDLVLKRDILWMAKNVIAYLLEEDKFLEAQRIMENFNTCNSFCDDNTNNNGGSGCGCHKN